LHLPGVAGALADQATWTATLDDLARRRPGDVEMLERSRGLLESGAVAHLVDDLLALRARPAPPRRIELNKAGRSRKVVYQLQPLDELLCRVLNRVQQPSVAPWISPRCHSFQPGRSVLTAYRSLLESHGVEGMASLHCDITDFFNSIDVDDLLTRLPPPLRDDAVLMAYLTALLATTRQGVMAGTPLAPLLTNVYLRDIDDALASRGVTSARYSDDILVLGTPSQVDDAERLIRDLLGARGLRLNEAKTRRGAPGEPWDFLGLRHDSGAIGLSDNTARRLRAKVRRRARRLARHRQRSGCDARHTCALFVASLNRKLYGVRARDDVEFSWARWFLPLLTTPAQLAPLDAYVQREVRWAASGSRRQRARSLVPYAALRDCGYLPLVSAYHAYRRRPAGFTAFVEERCGGAGVSTASL
jgi:hypothetical protein